MTSKKIRGYFVKFKEQHYGPVDTKDKANELCLYVLNKHQKLIIKGEGSLLEIKGTPPIVCKGNIRIDEKQGKVIKQEFKPLYEFNMKMNPEMLQKELIQNFIKHQEELNEQQGKSTT